MTREIKLIYTEERRGDGTDKNPWQMVPQLWTPNGELIGQRAVDVLDGGERVNDDLFNGEALHNYVRSLN